jgi:NADH-quinone oxidoreductase subunit L
MFAALGVGAFTAGVFHLMTHAFFKALLFLGSGAVIMAMHHEQDMTRMGGLRRHLPWTYRTMLVGTLAISGIPGLAGFFSKDEILWRAWSIGHRFVWLALWLAAGMTAFYMFRLLFLTFWGQERMDEHTRHHLHEPGGNVIYPLVVLAGLSIVGGWVGLPGWTGAGNTFEHFLEPVLRLPPAGEHAPAHASAAVELLFTVLSVAIAFVGIWLAHRFFVRDPAAGDRVAGRVHALHRILRRKYYVDELYDALFVNRTKDLGNACYVVDSRLVDGAVNLTALATKGTASVSGLFDRYVVDGLVNLVGHVNMLANRFATGLQTGLVQRYALGAVLGIVLFVLIFFNEMFRS